MAGLKALLASRSGGGEEVNLEKGKIFSFSNIATYSTYPGCFCWISPGTGKVELEVWGAGGSASRMCCCSATISGNSGAYAKRCIDVATNCYICGHGGKSCRNASTLCHRGCSEPGEVCWTGNSGSSGCMCAQGGWSGASWCTTGTARRCCFAANSWCNTTYSSYCGIICNACNSSWKNQAYGGQFNCPGVNSCVTFWHCYPNCNCSTIHHTAIPAGMFSEKGGVASYSLDSDNGHANWSGMSLNGFQNALNGLSRMPGGGTYWSNCWNGVRACGCYDTQGCSMFVPHGTGGPAATPCSGVRDNGWAGGDALIRIKYIES